jgi:hypothetical protein
VLLFDMSSSPTSPPVSPPVLYVNSPRNVKFPPTPENLRKFQVNVNSDSPMPAVRLFKNSATSSGHAAADDLALHVPTVPTIRHAAALSTVPTIRHAAALSTIHVPTIRHAAADDLAQNISVIPDGSFGELTEREKSIAAEARIDSTNHFNGDLHLVLKSLLLRDSERAAGSETQKPSSAAETQFDFVSSLSISDPAGNVMHDLSACAHLESKLVNEKISVATVQALFDHAVHRHPELLKIMGSVSKGHTLKFALLQFRNLFQSLFKPNRSTAAMISILAVAGMSPAAQIKVKTTIKVAASTPLDGLAAVAKGAAESGTIPVIRTDHKTMTLTELPGIRQLQSHSSPAEIERHWTAIETAVINSVCFVRFDKQEIAAARVRLSLFDAQNTEDKDLAIASYEELFDVCTNWFGKPIETDFDKVQRFVSKCPAIVKAEYVDTISNSKCNELEMSWDSFQPLLTQAWDTAFTKQRLRVELGLAQGQLAAHNPRQHQPQLLHSTQAQHHQNISTPADIEIVCAQCNEAFAHSAKRQTEYAAKEPPWDTPKRCHSCRSRDKECADYSNTGTCQYGSKCRFRHDNTAPPAETRAHSRLPRMLPGQHERICQTFAATGSCTKNDNCLFKHPGREHEQKVAAVIAKSRDEAPAEGFNGLTRRPTNQTPHTGVS